MQIQIQNIMLELVLNFHSWCSRWLNATSPEYFTHVGNALIYLSLVAFSLFLLHKLKKTAYVQSLNTYRQIPINNIKLFSLSLTGLILLILLIFYAICLKLLFKTLGKKASLFLSFSLKYIFILMLMLLILIIILIIILSIRKFSASRKARRLLLLKKRVKKIQFNLLDYLILVFCGVYTLFSPLIIFLLVFLPFRLGLLSVVGFFYFGFVLFESFLICQYIQKYIKTKFGNDVFRLLGWSHLLNNSMELGIKQVIGAIIKVVLFFLYTLCVYVFTF